ncbi:MAG: transcription antitermination factor NusB [Reichenbachiella sp.]
MQAIFAYHTAKTADFHICKKKAQDQFLPDLNSMEVQDKEGLAQDRADVAIVFDQIHETGLESVSNDTKAEIITEVQHFLNEWSNKVSESKIYFKKRMLSDINDIYADYIKILLIAEEFESLISEFKAKKNIEHNNFAKNIIIKSLKGYERLQNERAKKNLGWDEDIIKSWYKEYVRNEEFFEEYDNKPQTDYEDDLLYCQTLYKSVIFKNDSINEYFEALDLGWTEDKPIIKSMVLKTIKSVEKEGDEPVLMELSKNWDEDLDFLKELYDLTIEDEEELDSMIKDKSQNWDIDRVASTDKIILEMAISEMTNFPSIPIKVTINEYIELSKQYSTPKSKQFVNGLLDVLSLDLQKNGKIRKSGRGLLDNK